MSTLKVSTIGLNSSENTNITIGTNNLDLKLSVNGAERLILNSNGVNAVGTLRDTKGDVRDLTINNQTSSYLLTLSDTGKTISITTGNVFVPNAIFSAGHAVSIFNNSASSITITQNSSVTIYLGGTATTGNRTLAQRGIATMLCVAANTFVISGAGLT